MKTMFDRWQDGEITDVEMLSHTLNSAMAVTEKLMFDETKRWWYHLEQRLDGQWVSVSNKVYPPLMLTEKQAIAINSCTVPGYRWYIVE